MASGGTEAAGLIDSHAHLQDPKLLGQIGDILRRAREAGVCQVVAVGITAADSGELVGLAERCPGVFATVGVHPNETADAAPQDWLRVVELAGRPHVVGIGETGLDRYWDRAPFPLQQEWFGRHLELGHERDLAVVIHCREAEADVIGQLERLGRPTRGVLHSFTGNWDHAEAFLGLGLHISFAGMVTFKNKALDTLREVAARVPLDRLLVETDSPYLSPEPFRGRLNEPGRVAFTAAKVAEVRGMTPEALARATTANARRLFAIPERPVL